LWEGNRRIGQAADYGTGGPVHITGLSKVDAANLLAYAKSTYPELTFEQDGYLLGEIVELTKLLRQMRTLARTGRILIVKSSYLDEKGLPRQYVKTNVIRDEQRRRQLILNESLKDDQLVLNNQLLAA
jgi:hypothetical protein